MPKKQHDRVYLADLLADPLLWMMMKADKVGEADLITLVTSVALWKTACASGLSDGDAIVPEGPKDYRPGVGIVLLNTADQVFVGRRRKTKGKSWQMPQGGIDEGEAPRDAVFRELKEEIGTDQAEIVAESERWLFYDLPPDLVGKAWRGRWRGQRQKWFVMRFKGKDQDIDIKRHHAEFSDWKWVALDDLPDLIVSFKRPLYLEILEEFSKAL
ncbi:RNA pyrophosphohydrolase [mine drainage metagenome]|uniref:RNA pyrophosphohydrolase n=1 Tax=mine drainage metagenome TaxID=410659 RepID=A0A1J5RRB5_9ZZZZ